MKKIKLAFFCALSLLYGGHVFAQGVRFIDAGTVDFEKSINTHALIRKALQNKNLAFVEKEQYELYKNSFPQFKTVRSTLLFTREQSLYTPIADDEKSNVLSEHPAILQNGVTFSDLKGRRIVAQKTILNERFLLKDTVKKIQWKITGEVREICGYMCRRANAIVMDSVYVVAFYTDYIIPQGGPEYFKGLPGMILGVVLPHENVSWFAKSVTQAQSNEKIVVPSNGKEVSFSALKAIIETSEMYKRDKSILKFLLL